MKNLEENYISIVAVANNSGSFITEKLTCLNSLLGEVFKYYEIIIVDNYSSDKTIEELYKLAFPLTVVTLPRAHNMQSALTAGIELAIGDYILEIPNLNTDVQFSEIENMYRVCQQGNDFVFLSPVKSSTGSKIFYKILNRYFRGQLSERFVSSVMTLSSRRGQNKTAESGPKIVNRNVSYVMTGLKCAVVQTKSVSKNNRTLKENMNLMIDTMIYHTDYVYQSVMIVAFLFLGVSLLAIIYALVLFFAINTAPGWASTFILISVGFAALSGILATVCKYLSNIIKDKQSKDYTFSSVEKRVRKS